MSAALDVTDPEPPPAGHPLRTAPNVPITPHVGAFTESMRQRIYRLASAQAHRYFSGVPLVDQIRR
ncbi:NAD(P)-dependent oxidoreductase [Actinoplanes rectilineatus]